ncbi:MAG: UDP-N-acetylmuramoyl-tripeptide--D-alanyl-D-alanine ligase [bacterium]
MLLSRNLLAHVKNAVFYVVKNKKLVELESLDSLIDKHEPFDPSTSSGRASLRASAPKEYKCAIDSREFKTGQVFFALKGQRVDGHSFVGNVLTAGARAVIVSDLYSVDSEKALDGTLVILVPDTYKTLVNLAKAWRDILKIPFVGITGSLGKTSTKEMLGFILKKADIQAFVSPKNLNTTISLPINILNVSMQDKFAVFELGISTKGEMAQLADILRPDIALITCISYAHAQGLGSIEETAAEKRLIFKNFTSTHIGVVFGDQSVLSAVSYVHPVAKFGFKMKNQVQARKVEVITDADGNLCTKFNLKLYDQKVPVTLPGNHAGMVNNALAAATLAYLLKVPVPYVVAGIEQYPGFEHRFEKRKLKDYSGSIISDCYNANPTSMKAALKAFNQMEAHGATKIAVLGDMLELGEKEVYWHRQIGRFLTRHSGINVLILVGPLARYIAQTAPSISCHPGLACPSEPLGRSRDPGSKPSNIEIVFAQDYREAQKILSAFLSKGVSLVLVKASCGVQLRDVVNALTEPMVKTLGLKMS